MSEIDLNELADELEEFAEPEKKQGTLSAREERIIAGFEDIQRFYEEHGRAPQHGEERDIFERLYAVRLDRLRAQADCLALLGPMDHQGLLDGASSAAGAVADDIDEDELAAELEGIEGGSALTELRHVRSCAEKRAAEEIANRQRCENFERFKPLFEKVQRELRDEIRVAQVIRKDAGFLKTDIREGQFFILGGQTLYIAEVGEQIRAPNGETDARLRVIYSNGTESNLLLRSLQRAIYKDETSRMVSEPGAGPLFGDAVTDGDETSGTIYVLRSKSDLPEIARSRDVIHKIGITGGSVERRIANAKYDPTFLMADVEIVATYELFNINRAGLENIIHRVFGPARLDVQVKDRFGKPVTPREWFLVPLFAVDEAVSRIRDESISDYVYDPESASLVLAK